MNRTPEEIKKGLKCRIRLNERICDALCSKCEYHVPELTYSEIYNATLTYIQQLESVDAEPVRHGEWIDNGPDWVCSYCGTEFKDDIQFIDGSCAYYMPNYCPHCGAKMDLEASND